MKLITYKPELSDPDTFVAYWAAQYHDPHENLYTQNIGQPFTGQTIHPLFFWKNGMRLSAQKRQSVEDNYVAAIKKIATLPLETNARSFLNHFPKGGAIWRIFWLHCWQPVRYPIYDQHVHRAMAFIEKQKLEEIPESDNDKIELYLGKYLSFHGQFNRCDLRSVDKALWTYGKFIKTTRFPLN